MEEEDKPNVSEEVFTEVQGHYYHGQRSPGGSTQIPRRCATIKEHSRSSVPLK